MSSGIILLAAVVPASPPKTLVSSSSVGCVRHTYPLTYAVVVVTPSPTPTAALVLHFLLISSPYCYCRQLFVAVVPSLAIQLRTSKYSYNT